MLRIQDLSVVKGCPETRNVDFSQALGVPELMIIPQVLELLKYTKVFYLRCFIICQILTKLL